MDPDRDQLIDFGEPIVDQSQNIIKVIGVGGGGCNAVRNMYNEHITGVSLAACNTDSKSLAPSPVPVKIMLGEGLGAGGIPEVGRSEAEKSIDDIKKLLSDGTKMAFITASLGGGTGTGAAPVVAGIAQGMGILTVGVVTLPLYFEKKQKIIKALKGVEELRKNVDALLIINNERLCDVYADSNISVKESFARADNILRDAVMGIAELMIEAAKSRLSRLHITKDYRFILTDTNREIELQPVHKAVYMLFLAHPKGIEFKRLADHREELLRYYMVTARNMDKQKIEESVNHLINPLDNAINEKCSRIKKAFLEIMDAYTASYYIVSSHTNRHVSGTSKIWFERLKRITLPRELVTLDDPDTICISDE